mgnify:CR=1
MEHAQRVNNMILTKKQFMACLNPYFNGTCSKRLAYVGASDQTATVLILILMEHAQRVFRLGSSILAY